TARLSCYRASVRADCPCGPTAVLQWALAQYPASVTRMPLNRLGVPETEADWQFVVDTITRRSPVPPVGADLEGVHVAFLSGLAKRHAADGGHGPLAVQPGSESPTHRVCPRRRACPSCEDNRSAPASASTPLRLGHSWRLLDPTGCQPPASVRC